MCPIDLRSDTVTLPTQAMRQAMFECEVGDDVLREDPTINRLEETAARMLGKEAGLFVPSGTFGNQCAILTHVGSADEVIVSEGAHIIQHEAGGAALIARAFIRTVTPSNGSRLTLHDVESRVRTGDDYHCPKTRLICLEQATAYGELYTLETLRDIHQMAARHGIPVHVDGARFFNACVALGVAPNELASHMDTVTFCLSKGLCAPVGSVLVGSTQFIAKARRMRKVMGGGLRQAGFLAAAGLVALESMVQRLEEDHANARLFVELASQAKGIQASRQTEINMVFMRVTGSPRSESEILAELTRRGVLTYAPEFGEWRFLTHHGITREDVQLAARAFVEATGM